MAELRRDPEAQMHRCTVSRDRGAGLCPTSVVRPDARTATAAALPIGGSPSPTERRAEVSTFTCEYESSIALGRLGKGDGCVWSDNETDRDFLNFVVSPSQLRKSSSTPTRAPVSIGVSGSWGVGKSSMIKLTQAALKQRAGADNFVFIEFNAWLYQGYDDARTALLETIAARLIEEATARETGLDKAKDFSQRIKWLVSPS